MTEAMKPKGLLILILVARIVLGCAPALPEKAKVNSVIDGDTIVLADGTLLRYLGIDAPESRHKVAGRWLPNPEPFSREATNENRRLVEGKKVRLEYDEEKIDKYGRLLAYVWVEDVMVNAYLLEEGLAQTLILQPNLRYAARFKKLCDSARFKKRGLWGLKDSVIHGRRPVCDAGMRRK